MSSSIIQLLLVWISFLIKTLIRKFRCTWFDKFERCTWGSRAYLWPERCSCVLYGVSFSDLLLFFLFDRYLTQNLDWLHEELNAGEDDYFIFDLPGQIELYTHLPIMRQVFNFFYSWFYVSRLWTPFEVGILMSALYSLSTHNSF